MKFTIFGSKGYIGSALCDYLKLQNIECITPDIKNDKIPKENLGHVIYAIGVPNFKQNPMKAIDAHVFLLNRLLNETNFELLEFDLNIIIEISEILIYKFIVPPRSYKNNSIVYKKSIKQLQELILKL